MLATPEGIDLRFVVSAYASDETGNYRDVPYGTKSLDQLHRPIFCTREEFTSSCADSGVQVSGRRIEFIKSDMGDVAHLVLQQSGRDQ